MGGEGRKLRKNDRIVREKYQFREEGDIQTRDELRKRATGRRKGPQEGGQRTTGRRDK